MSVPKQPQWRAPPGFSDLLVSDEGGIKRRDGEPVSAKKLGNQRVVNVGGKKVTVDYLVDLAFPPELVDWDGTSWLTVGKRQVSPEGRVRTLSGTELLVEEFEGRRVVMKYDQPGKLDVDHHAERAARALADKASRS